MWRDRLPEWERDDGRRDAEREWSRLETWWDDGFLPPPLRFFSLAMRPGPLRHMPSARARAVKYLNVNAGMVF